jgi:hypothetical protein
MKLKVHYPTHSGKPKYSMAEMFGAIVPIGGPDGQSAGDQFLLTYRCPGR